MSPLPENQIAFLQARRQGWSAMLDPGQPIVQNEKGEPVEIVGAVANIMGATYERLVYINSVDLAEINNLQDLANYCINVGKTQRSLAGVE